VLEHQVVLSHPRNVACHPGADGLRVLVKCEVVVIGPDCDPVFCSKQQALESLCMVQFPPPVILQPQFLKGDLWDGTLPLCHLGLPAGVP
jgi:hypothetical protein